MWQASAGAPRPPGGEANQAAGVAQSLLQAGRGVYASGTQYADLFRQVNTQLRAAQIGSRQTAAGIEKDSGALKIVEATEQSTRALLTALGKLNASIVGVRSDIREQTKSLEKKQRVMRLGGQ